ncbi:aldo/keto reductase [Glaciihabitans arcticus]|uniref:Aldo/keto reductase n=1 Tax=Glaciihabitans arcticus TaxID=2668039 RepID=A0A4Q9GWS4_9MICO|nr:aldo/keto reductase [Glaciihabitans arcticus]TBN57677.1 aldo/keto reductase [Glaciihabitans arcticus]
MRDRLVHGTDIRLTEIAFGGASLGNLYSVTSDEDAAASVAQAWESGIRYFDTAPHYGLGLSERRLGAALSSHARGDYVISSKVGRLIVPNENPTEFDDDGFIVPGDLRREWDFTRDGVLRSVEASLARLDTDYIDILYLHDPDASEIPDAAATGAAALIELRDQGVVRAVGIGSNSASAVAQLFRESDVDLAMLAGRYTLLEQRGADEVFEAAGEKSIVAVGVFNSGLLSADRPKPTAMYNYLPATADVIARANRLADSAESHGATLPQAALAFPLRNSQVVSIAIGMRNAQQVTSNVELYERGVNEAAWAELEAQTL